MLDAALTYIAAGLSVIPIDPQTKRPYSGLLPTVDGRRSWKPFQERIASEHEIRKWFSRPRINIGIVCGAVSGGLIVLDFDVHADTVYPQFLKHCPWAVELPVVKTGKGYHLYLRTDAPEGNQDLAKDRAGHVLIQTRGEGGYVLAPPSIHPSGARYEVLNGSLTNIPAFTRGLAGSRALVR